MCQTMLLLPVHLAPIVGGRQDLGESGHQVMDVVHLLSNIII
jgi:hypothetical protein